MLCFSYDHPIQTPTIENLNSLVPFYVIIPRILAPKYLAARVLTITATPNVRETTCEEGTIQTNQEIARSVSTRVSRRTFLQISDP